MKKLFLIFLLIVISCSSIDYFEGTWNVDSIWYFENLEIVWEYPNTEWTFRNDTIFAIDTLFYDLKNSLIFINGEKYDYEIKHSSLIEIKQLKHPMKHITLSKH